MYEVSSKFLEGKDIIDIAIVQKIFNKTQLLRLILMLYENRLDAKNPERIFPISLYKIFILYADFEIFEYLIQHEPHVSNRDILTFSKYSIICSSPMFSIYFAKAYAKQLDKLKHDIIQELLYNIETANGRITHSIPKTPSLEFLTNRPTFD